MLKEFCAMVCYNIIRPMVDQKKDTNKTFSELCSFIWVKIVSDWNDEPHYYYHDNKNASIKNEALNLIKLGDPYAHVAA